MVDGVLMILAGLFSLLVGLGIAQVRTNDLAHAAFVASKGKFFLIAGPIVALAGIVATIEGALR